MWILSNLQRIAVGAEGLQSRGTIPVCPSRSSFDGSTAQHSQNEVVAQARYNLLRLSINLAPSWSSLLWCSILIPAWCIPPSDSQGMLSGSNFLPCLVLGWLTWVVYSFFNNLMLNNPERTHLCFIYYFSVDQSLQNT